MAGDIFIEKMKSCSKCDAVFPCSPRDCWCSKLPAVMPLDGPGDCYCPECLKKIIDAKLEGSS